MASYAIMRIEKRKMSAVGKICKHHERLKEQYKSNPDIDSTRTHLNYHLVKPDADYRNILMRRITEVGAKRRKDSVVMQDGLVTASPDWLKEKTIEEQREYFHYAFQFIKERYGSENMISVVVHMDEKTPHMHFSFVPITKDGRLSSKDIMGGPKGMSKLQDDFHEHMVSRYPDLSRGIPSRVTHRTHVPVYLFKNAGNLYEHYEEICQAVKDIGLIGNSKAKDHAIELLGKYAPEMAKMAEQLKITDKAVSERDRLLQQKESALSMFVAENREQGELLDKQFEEIEELNRKQKELQAQIDKIPPEIFEQLRRTEQEKRKRNKGKEQIR